MKLINIAPKLPMRDKSRTREFYVNHLGFSDIGRTDFEGYLMIKQGNVEIHFFEFKELDPASNYAQVYIRTNDIEMLYLSMLNSGEAIHPQGHLAIKPWGQKEFAMLDPDNNLITFGQGA